MKQSGFVTIVVPIIAITVLLAGGIAGYAYINRPLLQQGQNNIASPLPTNVHNQIPSIKTLSQESTTSAFKNETSLIWNEICGYIKEKDFIVDVSKGDGVTILSRKAISQYFNYITLSPKLNSFVPRLNAEENVYAEDYIRKKFTFPDLSKVRSVNIPCKTVEEATLRARQLTISQKANLEKYGDDVFEYQVNDILQEELEELYKDAPELRENSGFIRLQN